ncbi:MAG: hypothetical protein ACRCZS_27950 [Chroococcidiopsis sp.]
MTKIIGCDRGFYNLTKACLSYAEVVARSVGEIAPSIVSIKS